MSTQGEVVDHGTLAQYWIGTRELRRMVQFLAPRFVSLSPIVAANLLSVYASPTGSRSLKRLSAAWHMSERHLRRLLLTLGIPSRYLYFSASRVLEIYEDVSMGIPVAEIARRHGFGTPRTVRNQWLHITGFSLESARGLVLTDALLESWARRVALPLAPGL